MQKELSEMDLEELWKLFPIVLAPPNKCWSSIYEEEQKVLLALLHDVKIARISHIGSTAIESIWAKPIIDILIEVDDNYSFNIIYRELISQGYLCMVKSESRIDFNKGYTNHGIADKVFHIHFRLTGDSDELYFRDYLNDNPMIAKEYEQLKLSFWKKYEHDRDGYIYAKTEFKKYIYLAKQAYVDRYDKK